jgi:hypothetical protein
MTIPRDSIAKPEVTVESITVEYKKKKVQAKKLTVSSKIPIRLADAWQLVQTPKLLQFVSKGMISFLSVDGMLPDKWEVNKTYGVKMRIFGFFPFGGTHYLQIESIDHENHEIETREWDQSAKIWNHKVTMSAQGTDAIQYEDTIVIYGGLLTGFITAFAREFYKHRQRRWCLVKDGHLFSE